MKKSIPHLQVGDAIRAVVVECLEHKEIIVDFKGDLVRVQNQANQVFRVGQELSLRVEKLSPLQFKLIQGRPLAKWHLDVNI